MRGNNLLFFILGLTLLSLFLWHYTQKSEVPAVMAYKENTQRTTGDYKEFLEKAEQQLHNNTLDSVAFYLDKAIMEKNEDHWDSLLSKLLFRVGLHYHELSFYGAATPYLVLLTENFAKHGSVYFQIIGLQHLAATRTFEGRFETAKHTYAKMKKHLDNLDRNTHSPDTLIDLYTNYYFGLGINDAIQGDFRGSLTWFMTADSLLKMGGNKRYKVACMLYLGNINLELVQVETALDYYKKVEQLNLQGEKVDLLQLYDNMAVCYTQLEDFEKAVHFLDKNLVLAREKGDSFVVGLNYKERASIEEKQSNYNQAIAYAKRAKQLFKLAGNKLMFYETGVYKLRLALQAKSEITTSDIQELQKAIIFFDTSGVKTTYFRALKVLANVYTYNKRFKEASEIFRDYTDLYASWMEENYNIQTAAMQTRFKTEMYKNEAALANDLKIQSKKLNNLLTYSSISAFLLLIVVCFLVYLYRKLSASKAKIKLQNLDLEKSDLEKSLLIKELHHRVKNNLQIVSSLLNLQSNSTKDKNAQNAFKEGKHRVEAMAMIHKYLYTSDELTDVDIKSYMARLVDSIAFAYGYNKKNIEMVLDIEPAYLDVDVAIPLGLIANELLSNAFKHAFSQVKLPHLRIQLTDKENICLVVSDNGKGLGDCFTTCKGSFGLELMKSLTCQLNATLTYRFESGAVFTLVIPKTNIVKRKLDL